MGKIMTKEWAVQSNREIASDTWEIRLSCPMADTGSLFEAPGRFVNLQIEGVYLRRPLSVCHAEKDTITLIYRVVGKGTALLAAKKPGQTINVLFPLGNGFDTKGIPTKGGNPDDEGRRIVLIGGGVGLPPLYGLAKKLIAQGQTPDVIMGFATRDQIFYKREFEELGVSVTVATMDGSEGTPGTVLDGAGSRRWDYLFACGPEPMLKGIRDLAADGQFSFEGRMGCGFGVCMGCSCRTKYGEKRICVDGPVLKKEEILW